MCVAAFPQKSSVIIVNADVPGSVRACMPVTTMEKERWRDIDLTDGGDGPK
jgi:hypothetical protein